MPLCWPLALFFGFTFGEWTTLWILSTRSQTLRTFDKLWFHILEQLFLHLGRKILLWVVLAERRFRKQGLLSVFTQLFLLPVVEDGVAVAQHRARVGSLEQTVRCALRNLVIAFSQRRSARIGLQLRHLLCSQSEFRDRLDGRGFCCEFMHSCCFGRKDVRRLGRFALVVAVGSVVKASATSGGTVDESHEVLKVNKPPNLLRRHVSFELRLAGDSWVFELLSWSLMLELRMLERRQIVSVHV